MALLRSGQPLAALDDLHTAKAQWWTGDRIRGALLTLLLLARTYERLGLHVAARQHALVAVGAAHAVGGDEHGDLIAAGLMTAAHLDYRTGAWAAAAETYHVAMLAHVQHLDDPWDAEQHDDLVAAQLHGLWLRASSRHVSTRLRDRIIELQRRSRLAEVVLA